MKGQVKFFPTSYTTGYLNYRPNSANFVLDNTLEQPDSPDETPTDP